LSNRNRSSSATPSDAGTGSSSVLSSQLKRGFQGPLLLPDHSCNNAGRSLFPARQSGRVPETLVQCQPYGHWRDGLGVASAHSGSAREGRRQSSGCSRCSSQCGGMATQGESKLDLTKLVRVLCVAPRGRRANADRVYQSSVVRLRRKVPIVPAIRRVVDVIAISRDGSVSRSSRDLARLPSFIG
jgi:hypothetical protein